jgi:4-hydroxyproline epimerase
MAPPPIEIRVRVIDSHTGGEPTRVVYDGGPDLGAGPLTERRTRFREQFDWFRSAVINEPRGSDVIVGAILTPPTDPAYSAAVLYFNNVAYLGMCGHGTIGLVVTLLRLGIVGPGKHKLETAVGIVGFETDGGSSVTIENVPSYRLRKAVEVDVPGIGRVSGDIAWGGNWFFLIDGHGLDLVPSNIDRLTNYALRVREELGRQGITGADGGEIDHLELNGPPRESNNSGRNFVLCPGKAYDRSPCGTGTSAKLACLYADGKIKPGDVWRQESVVGSLFEGSVRVSGDKIIPRITGSAFVTAEATLILDPADPFRTGLPT